MTFLPRDAIYNAAYVVRWPSACLSVTFVYCIETAKRALKIFHLLIAQPFYTVSGKITDSILVVTLTDLDNCS